MRTPAGLHMIDNNKTALASQMAQQCLPIAVNGVSPLKLLYWQLFNWSMDAKCTVYIVEVTRNVYIAS